jgi:hypothetical protein
LGQNQPSRAPGGFRSQRGAFVIRPRGYRGQPLVALSLVLGGWVALRAMAWDAGMAPAEAQSFMPPASAGYVPAQDVGGFAGGVGLVGSGAAMWSEAPVRFAGFPEAADEARSARQLTQDRRSHGAWLRYTPSHREDGGWQLMPGPSRARSTRLAVGSAASSQTSASAPFSVVGGEPGRRDKRWSGDAWILTRSGGSAFVGTGVSPATYGASQAGAVLRYRIAPRNGHRPAAYLRTSSALNGSDEQEVALGLSARPFAKVPVVAAAELRATRQQGGMQVRPAAMLITELAPVDLPMGTQAEVYGQAGYVGGRFATAFADGQLRVDRGVARLGKGELRAGAGVWGGAQKGASRLDIGPTAAMALGIGKGRSARLAVDWRFRVYGNAEPDSGPAMTLSAGF